MVIIKGGKVSPSLYKTASRRKQLSKTIQNKNNANTCYRLNFLKISKTQQSHNTANTKFTIPEK